MTAETLDVMTVQVRSSASISLIGSGLGAPADRLSSEVWTAMSDSGLGGESPMAPGTPALLVVEGLIRALTVRIHEGPDGAFVADIRTTVFGVGDTLPEAVADFKDALNSHLAVLTEEGALAPNLQHQLEVLRSYFTTP